MNNELRLAARLTIANRQISSLRDNIAREQAQLDQLQAAIRELEHKIATLERLIERLERDRQARRIIIRRLRKYIREARASRDLWKHRALRGQR